MREDVKAIVGDNTTVLTVLNGVTSEQVIGEAIGRDHMMYSFMRIGASRVNGQIRYTSESTAGLFFGEGENVAITPRGQAIEELMKEYNIRCTYVEKIMTEMWLKYVGNISQNLPQAILSVGFGAYKDSEHVAFIAEKLWKEVVAVAKEKGIQLPDRYLPFRGEKKTSRFSTLQDLDAGRHTEIEMLAGEMIRMGNECGVSVPYCEYTYHLIRALEEKNDGKFDYA